MNFATIKPYDVANGPGIRVSLFVSGCTHQCKGCFNQVAWDFEYGNEFTEKIMNHLLSLLKPNYIQGLTLLGGEPMDPRNQEQVLQIIKNVKQHYPQKNIWVYSGYTFEKLISGKVGDADIVKEIFDQIDVLVDGPFVEEKKNLMLKFRGSENQRLIDIPKTIASGNTVCEILM